METIKLNDGHTLRKDGEIMTPIQINPENKEEIEILLASVNGDATGQTFTTYEEIVEVAKEAERRTVDLVVYEDELEGAECHTWSGTDWEDKSKRMLTEVHIRRSAIGWSITAVGAHQRSVCTAGHVIMYLTERQDELAHMFLAARYKVRTRRMARK